jgi:phosphoesterase RecJ-like protein
MDKKDVKKLLELIKKAENIMITTHITPDVDAIGSTVGLYWILKGMGKKKVEMVLEDTPPANTSFLEGTDRVRKVSSLSDEISKYDLVFLLDANTSKRYSRSLFATSDTGNPKQKIVRIDHHASKTDLNIDLSFVENDTASTAEILFKIFNEETTISSQSANALLAGVYDDTHSFSIRGVTKETFEIAAALIALGGDIDEIAEKINTYSEEILKATKAVVDNLQFDKKGKYSYTYISRDIYEELNMDGMKMDTVMNLIIDMLLGREGYRWGFLVRPDGPKSTKISFRARTGAQNVRKIAEKLGGGGHDEAAGANFLDIEDPYEAVAKVRKTV